MMQQTFTNTHFFMRRRKDAHTPTADPAPASGRRSFFSTEPPEKFTAPTMFRIPGVNEAHVLADVGIGGMDAAELSSVKAAFGFTNVTVPDAQIYWFGGQGFIGHQLCAIIAQHWLVDKACWIPARDAIRNGFKLSVNEDIELDSRAISMIERANKKYKLNKNLVEFVKFNRVFGIRLALCVVDSNDPDYYVKPFNPDSITPGSYRGISQIDPYWTTPELTSATIGSPLAINYYEPEYWVVGGKRIHRSHLVIAKGSEVPDILKPAYLYGGVSVPQKIYERVYAAERTANEAPQLALTKRTNVLKTDLSKAVANQQAFEARLNQHAQWWDNYGIRAIDLDDEMSQLDTNLADLDAAIMTQYQLVASAANVPVTKLLGTSPKGFNASGEYDSDSYYEELESIQTDEMLPLLERHLLCVIKSEIEPRLGKLPAMIDVTWNPLDVITAKEQAEIELAKANTRAAYINAGAVDPGEVRQVLNTEETSGFNGLAEVPSYSDETETG